MSDCIDKQALKAIESLQRPGKPDLLKHIVGLFKSESEKSIKAVQDGAVVADMTSIRNAAHTLKSSSAYVGAHGLSQCCKEIEIAAMDNNVLACVALGDNLEALFEDSCVEIDQYLARAA